MLGNRKADLTHFSETKSNAYQICASILLKNWEGSIGSSWCDRKYEFHTRRQSPRAFLFQSRTYCYFQNCISDSRLACSSTLVGPVSWRRIPTSLHRQLLQLLFLQGCAMGRQHWERDHEKVKSSVRNPSLLYGRSCKWS